MSIVKTTFSGTNIYDQQQALLNWLNANASEYFTTIEYDSNSKFLYCDKSASLGNNGALTFSFQPGAPYVGFVFYNCNSSSGFTSIPMGSFSSSYKPYFDYAIKTNCGMYINWRFSGVSTPNGVFISKSNTGSTYAVYFCIGYSGSSSSSTYGFLGCADIGTGEGDGTRSGNIWAGVYSNYLYSNATSKQANYTTMTPFVSQVRDVYCPYIYQLHFNQYVGQVGKLTLDNKDYFTNGYIALADYDK